MSFQGQVKGYMTLVLAFGRLMQDQEDYKFKASLYYIVSSRLALTLDQDTVTKLNKTLF